MREVTGSELMPVSKPTAVTPAGRVAVIKDMARTSCRITSLVTSTYPFHGCSGGEHGPLDTARLTAPAKLMLFTVRPSAPGMPIQPFLTVSKSTTERDDVLVSKAVLSSYRLTFAAGSRSTLNKKQSSTRAILSDICVVRDAVTKWVAIEV